MTEARSSLAWPYVPQKGMPGHYCQHSVIQCHSVTRKNVIAKRLHTGVTGRLTTTAKD